MSRDEPGPPPLRQPDRDRSRVSDEQLWSWVDRDAPELSLHLSNHPEDRVRVDELRRAIRAVAGEGREERTPKRIGPYPIRRRLGSGGMGVVFEADQARTNRRVAIKVIRGAWLDDERTRRLFFREAEVLGRLDHPGIARIFDAGETKEGAPYFVMELVDGLPLDEWSLDRSLETRVEAISQVARAVHHAHAKGVIHRDLKPSNVMVTGDDEAKVLDFGLARIVDPSANASLTAAMSGKVIGTVRYMSPEQARGFASRVTPASDVYTLGVLLYELVCGALPHEFDGLDLFECARRVAENDIVAPSTRDARVPEAIDRIAMRSLAKDPDARYGSAIELAEDLERFLGGESVEAPPLDDRDFDLARSIERWGQTVGAAIGKVSEELARATRSSGGQRTRDASRRALEGSRKAAGEVARAAREAAERARTGAKRVGDSVRERRGGGGTIHVDLNPAMDRIGGAVRTAGDAARRAAGAVRRRPSEDQPPPRSDSAPARAEAEPAAPVASHSPTESSPPRTASRWLPISVVASAILMALVAGGFEFEHFFEDVFDLVRDVGEAFGEVLEGVFDVFRNILESVF